jgi:hypothetical protein
MNIASADLSSPQRSCGGCTLCCKIMAIDELKKPPGEWCPNCKGAQGCAIYGAHPPSCRYFVCEWLRNSDVPQDFRPDAVKVVLTTAMWDEGAHLIANCDADNPMAWRDQPVYGWLKARAAQSWQRGGWVMARVVKRIWLIGPNGDLDVGDVNDETRLLMEQRSDGTYATRYEV